MWLTLPETSKADEQDVSIRETEATPQLVEVSICETENSDTTKDRSDASKNDDISVNSEIKKSIIAAGPQPEGRFPKNPLQNGFPLFPSQMLSIKTSFREKIAHLKSAKEMAFFWLLKMHHLPQLILTFVRYT